MWFFHFYCSENSSGDYFINSSDIPRRTPSELFVIFPFFFFRKFFCNSLRISSKDSCYSESSPEIFLWDFLGIPWEITFFGMLTEVYSFISPGIQSETNPLNCSKLHKFELYLYQLLNFTRLFNCFRYVLWIKLK